MNGAFIRHVRASLWDERGVSKKEGTNMVRGFVTAAPPHSAPVFYPAGIRHANNGGPEIGTGHEWQRRRLYGRDARLGRVLTSGPRVLTSGNGDNGAMRGERVRRERWQMSVTGRRSVVPRSPCPCGEL